MNEPAADNTNLYGGYAQWKRWDGDFQASQRDARYFAAEFSGIALAGKRVLEIGFGNGSFLAWAKTQGASVAGTEIDEAMLGRAREKGFVALPPALDALAAGAQRFDVVVAFDVFEHWDKQTLIANLRHIASLLDGGGVVLARFPNGHSPFGRVHQHGDITHQTALSKSSIEQLASMTGFGVVRVSNAASVPVRSDIWSVIKHRWRKRRRAQIEQMIGKLYGIGRLPLDPNLTAVLRKLD
jgi:cyclopropane fatty-acyl-phospholipid synthase-like methyltransferase